MIVSNIEMGAGSSGLSTRPSLPTAWATSGIASRARSSLASTSRASPMDAWGMVVGMNRKLPSSRGGMNSLPSPGKTSRASCQGALRWTAPGTKPNSLSTPSQASAPSSTMPPAAPRNRLLWDRHQRSTGS